MTTTERSRVRDCRPQRLIETLRMVAEGHTYAAIGRQIGLTEEGVKQRMRDLFEQLGARSAAHAVHIAHKEGLL